MPDALAASPDAFPRFGLIVTGKGEREFLPDLFRSLQASASCEFRVLNKVRQRSAITSPKKKLKMLGRGKTIPDRDAEEIGLPARGFLQAYQRSFVLLIDDLEHDRRPQRREVFDRYRTALDTMLKPMCLEKRAAVHFLVNMLEPYYFADAKAVNAVLGTSLEDHQGDVEEDIRHPKNRLKELAPHFHEISHGREILRQLDVEHVLSDPRTCRSLRALFGWCCRALGLPATARYQLACGEVDHVTGSQPVPS